MAQTIITYAILVVVFCIVVYKVYQFVFTSNKSNVCGGCRGCDSKVYLECDKRDISK